MTKQIWVIEEGSYSDYKVVGVFSSEANAQMVYDVLHKNSDEMREPTCWPLDPVVDEIRKGYVPFQVMMLKDGTVESTCVLEQSSYNLGNTFWIWFRTQAAAFRNQGVPDVLQCTIWAKSEKQAIKSANEHRTMMIANGEWK